MAMVVMGRQSYRPHSPPKNYINANITTILDSDPVSENHVTTPPFCNFMRIYPALISSDSAIAGIAQIQWFHKPKITRKVEFNTK